MPDNETLSGKDKAGHGAASADERAETAAQGVYFALLNATNQGFCTIEVKFDDEQRPVDYLFLEVNPSFERQTGIENAVGRWMREIAPNQDQFWFDIYGRVALTGESERFENFSTPLDRWFSVNALKIDGAGRVAILFDDITDRKRAEAALRESEQQFETLLNQAPLGVYLVDSDLVIRQVNPVALPVFGDIAGGPVGRDFDEVMHILWDKKYADEVVSIFRHTLATGEPYITAERAEIRVDHDIIEYYEWRLDRIALSGGQHGVVCYFRDISAQVDARKEIEQGREFARVSEGRQAFQLQLSDALRSLADPAEIMAVASEMIGRHLGVGRAGYGEVDANNEWFVVKRDWTDGVMTSMTGSHRVADFGPASVAAHRSDQAVVVDDAPNDPRFADHQAAFKAIGVEASLVVPLIKEERWIAGFYAQQSSPRRWTADDENLVRDVAERTWAAVERARAETASKRAEARVQQLVTLAEVSSEFFGTCDMEFMPTFGNAAAMRLVGLADLDQVKQTPLQEFFFPEDLAFITDEFFPRVLREGQGKTEIRFRHFVTGEPVWVVYNLVALKDEMGQAIGLGTVTHDITERKRTEAILRDSERHQGLLLAELQHRVRNILTMVRSVARRTAENCEDVADYVRHLDGRLSSLTRVQTILTRRAGQGVDLYDLVFHELEMQTDSLDQYRIEGPEVELSPKAAEVLSLAVHELATNSIKYGVLSGSSGTVRIGWSVDDRDGQAWLRFTWNEPIGRQPGRPSRTGFGTDLIKNRVPYELRGTGEIRIGRDQVEAQIDFPLAKEKSKLHNSVAEKDTGQ